MAKVAIDTLLRNRSGAAKPEGQRRAAHQPGAAAAAAAAGPLGGGALKGQSHDGTGRDVRLGTDGTGTPSGTRHGRDGHGTRYGIFGGALYRVVLVVCNQHLLAPMQV